MKDKIEQATKEISITFFRWWWNQPSNNTDQGYDDWTKTNKGKELLSQLDSLLKEVAEGQREVKKPMAEIIIKPQCIEAHGGENEAFAVAMEEMRKRYILWTMGTKPRQFRFQLYIDDL